MTKSVFRIAFVLGHQWGEVRTSSYESLTKSICHNIALTSEDDLNYTYETETFSCKDSAVNWTTYYAESRGAIVFMSRSAKLDSEHVIKKLQEEGALDLIRVVIMTGLIPREEVLWIDKGSFSGSRDLLKILKA